MGKSIERRIYPRVSLSVAVDLESEHNFFVGRTRDVSLGGVFVEISFPLGVGSQVDLKLDLLGTRIAAPCEVMWILEPREGRLGGMGLRFRSLSPAYYNAIRSFVAHRAPIDLSSAG